MPHVHLGNIFSFLNLPLFPTCLHDIWRCLTKHSRKGHEKEKSVLIFRTYVIKQNYQWKHFRPFRRKKLAKSEWGKDLEMEEDRVKESYWFTNCLVYMEGKERPREKVDHSSLAGGKFKEQENLLQGLSQPLKCGWCSPPTYQKLKSLFRGLNWVQPCI